MPAIATSEGALVLDTVQPAGKKRMSGEVFLNGARDWQDDEKPSLHLFASRRVNWQPGRDRPGAGRFPAQRDWHPAGHRLAEKWQEEGRQFDGIITSPLKRARRLRRSSQNTWEERSSRRPTLAGTQPGASSPDCPRKKPIQTENAWILSPRHVQPGETGESTAQVAIRAGYAVQSLMKRPPGRYLVVSHGAILSSVFHTIHNIKKVSDDQGVHFIILNTGYAEYEYNCRTKPVGLSGTDPANPPGADLQPAR